MVDNIAGSDNILKDSLLSVTNSTAIINKIESSNIIIFPNPTKSKINIEADKYYRVKLIDISGTILQENLC